MIDKVELVQVVKVKQLVCFEQASSLELSNDDTTLAQ